MAVERVHEEISGQLPGLLRTHNRIDDAITREKEIKGWRRSKKNALVETLNLRWIYR